MCTILITTARMYSSISKGCLQEPDVVRFFRDLDTDKRCKITFPLLIARGRCVFVNKCYIIR